jgi:antitoxin VapB
MNIKNEEAHRLAGDLAALTGETQTTAVTIALRERLARMQGCGGRDRAARLLAIGRECAAHLVEPYRSGDPDSLLYDERGLPR